MRDVTTVPGVSNTMLSDFQLCSVLTFFNGFSCAEILVARTTHPFAANLVFQIRIRPIDVAVSERSAPRTLECSRIRSVRMVLLQCSADFTHASISGDQLCRVCSRDVLVARYSSCVPVMARGVRCSWAPLGPPREHTHHPRSSSLTSINEHQRAPFFLSDETIRPMCDQSQPA